MASEPASSDTQTISAEEEGSSGPELSGPGIWELFRTWAGVGFQSFGGGASAQFLIQEAFIEKHAWITREEYLHLWGLCVFVPGVNMISFTVLLGRKLGGVWGIAASLGGLLGPSAIITCLLAALFKHIQGIAAVQSVLRGVIPATAGVMLLVGVNFARPLLRRAYTEGYAVLLVSGLFIIVCALAVIFLKLSVIVVILGAIALGAAIFTPRKRPALSDRKRVG
jgi:chromate transporter